MPVFKRAFAAPVFAVVIVSAALSLAPSGFPLRDVALDLGGGARLVFAANSNWRGNSD